METLQIILIISLIVVCVAAATVLIYFLFILKDVKETVKEMKEISKTGRKITSSIIAPISTVMGLAGGLTKGIGAIRSITDLFNNEEEDEYEEY